MKSMKSKQELAQQKIREWAQEELRKRNIKPLTDEERNEIIDYIELCKVETKEQKEERLKALEKYSTQELKSFLQDFYDTREAIERNKANNLYINGDSSDAETFCSSGIIKIENELKKRENND